jgi:hypothetical protein
MNMKMYAELARYVYPQRKAIAVCDDEKEPVLFTISWQKSVDN